MKLIGDEAMLVGDDPAALCAAAIDICAMAHADPVLPDVWGSVGYGMVTACDGDYFGPVVNVVARALKVAAPGEIVVTDAVVEMLDPGEWASESVGVYDLRGVGNTTVWTVSAPRGAIGPNRELAEELAAVDVERLPGDDV